MSFKATGGFVEQAHAQNIGNRAVSIPLYTEYWEIQEYYDSSTYTILLKIEYHKGDVSIGLGIAYLLERSQEHGQRLSGQVLQHLDM